MKVLDRDITTILRNVLPVKSFLFNPSIAHISGNIYLVSVRSYIHNMNESMDYNPKLQQNSQHPWNTDWSGYDVTFILPMIITPNFIQPITTMGWPIKVPVQDMRIYKFITYNQYVAFILTFNERYEAHPKLLIKGGDSCDDPCYLVGWSYLLVDINTLEHYYLPGQKPLCANISNPVEKNWSLWKYNHVDKLYLLVSYALTPTHSAFSLTIDHVKDQEMVGATTCRMITARSKDKNIFADLEAFYEQNLFVSLSTPSYKINDNEYQSVGHLKVKIKYIHKLSESKQNTPLAKFARKFVAKEPKKHLNPNYIYMMFVYRFHIIELAPEDPHAGIIELTDSNTRIKAAITHVSPAFVSKVDEYDYFLNFPSGVVIGEQQTIISYGDGDATSHLLYINNDDLRDFLIPIDELEAKNFSFMHGIKKGTEIVLDS